jgi:hypothetical protein
MERFWPNTRMVAAVADAIPACAFPTELMIEFIFGGEKIP